MSAYLAKRIRMLLLDVDGVLTDNLNIQGIGTDAKAFFVPDKTGIRLMQDRAGILVGIATGRESPATRLFAEEMGITNVSISPDGKKLWDVAAMLERLRMGWEEVCFVGDDLADMPVMRKVGFPIAVANAIPRVKEMAKYITQAEGGRGAVREVVEMLLDARGELEACYDYELTLRETPGHPADGRVVKGDRIEQREGHGAE